MNLSAGIPVPYDFWNDTDGDNLEVTLGPWDIYLWQMANGELWIGASPTGLQKVPLKVEDHQPEWPYHFEVGISVE